MNNGNLSLQSKKLKNLTTSNSEPNLSSVFTTLQQLEAEQSTWKQNTIWLKRYFDELKQEFNNRPEVGQAEKMQSHILQLTQALAELQERFNQLSSKNNVRVITIEAPLEDSFNQLPLVDNVSVSTLEAPEREKVDNAQVESKCVKNTDEFREQKLLENTWTIDNADAEVSKDIQNVYNAEEQEKFNRNFYRLFI